MKITDVVKEGHLNLAEGVETDAKVYQNKMTGKFVAWVEIGGKKIDKEGSTKEEALQNLVDHINSLKASRKTATSSRTEVGFTGGFVSLLGMDKFFAKFENGKLLVSDQPLSGYRLVSGAVGQVSPTGNFSVDDIQKAGLELSARYDIKSTDVSGVFNLKHHSDVWGTHDKYYRRDPQLTIQVTGRNTRQQGMAEGMAQDEAEETNGWRAELVNQINYNTFEVKMTNTRSRESANFVVRPVDMISIGPTLQIETMDVHDLQTGQTASWTSDDPQPDGGIVYAIAMMFWDNKELQKKLWTIVDTHNTKGQDTMPGLDQRRSIGQEVDADAYIDSQEKTQDVMTKMKQGTLKEFSPIKPPTAGAFGGNKDYGQPTSSRYLGNNKFVLGTTNNYVLTATVDKWGLEWDEDDEIWFLDSPGAVYIADATEGEIELPAPQEQRNQIHDLVSDYLNARNSAELQRVAAYYGHSADGEMATSEGLIAAAIGGGLLWHALKDDDIDDESVYDDEAHEYGIQAYHDGEEQDDNPYSEDFPNTRRAWDYGWAEAHNADISQKTPTTAIPTKINSPADFSKHGFTGYKKPGDMEEGIRVPAQQILGTKNRAKSAYYPTNVKPKVPKLDKPLTDQELARLAQLAGIKSK